MGSAHYNGFQFRVNTCLKEFFAASAANSATPISSAIPPPFYCTTAPAELFALFCTHSMARSNVSRDAHSCPP